MILHDAAAEIVFFDPIDANFPYNDAGRASALIAQGWSISLNAAFFILSEICQPGHGAPVGRPRLLELLAEWRSGPDHALKDPVLQCAKVIIDDAPLPLEDGLRIMDEIATYDGQRSALSIVSFAAYSEAPGVDDALGEAYERIVGEWERKGV
jgi:hypothetical protein